MEVVILVSEGCMSVGDALRDIDAKALINSDFVLVNGDMVANVNLAPIIQAHKLVYCLYIEWWIRYLKQQWNELAKKLHFTKFHGKNRQTVLLLSSTSQLLNYYCNLVLHISKIFVVACITLLRYLH